MAVPAMLKNHKKKYIMFTYNFKKLFFKLFPFNSEKPLELLVLP